MGRERLWIGASALIVGIVLIGASWQYDQRQVELARDGAPVEAVVTALEHYSGKSSWHEVRYRYQPPGHPPLDGSASVDERDWQQPQVGDPLALRYDPRSPTEHALVGIRQTDRSGIWILGVGCLVICLVEFLDPRNYTRSERSGRRVSQASIDYFERTQRRR